MGESQVVPYSKKNCNIIMKDGTVWYSDQQLGLNLDKVDIEYCLEDTGFYDVFTEKGWKRLRREEIKEIVEVDDIGFYRNVLIAKGIQAVDGKFVLDMNEQELVSLYEKCTHTIEKAKEIQ